MIGYGIITDFLCSLLPLVVIWRVHIPLRRKLLVCGLMSLGLLATGFGIGRAVSIGNATEDLKGEYLVPCRFVLRLTHADPEAYCIAAIWANLELLLGITAANLALARSAYAYFTGAHEHERKQQLASQSRASLTRSAYLQAEAKLRGDTFDMPKLTIHYGDGGGSSSGRGGAGGFSTTGSDVDDGEYTASEISAGREDREARLEGGEGAGINGREVVPQRRASQFWIGEEELRRDSLAGQGGHQPGIV